MEESVCRCCGNSNGSVDVFGNSEDDKSVTYSEMITACTSSPICKNDHLPKKMCFACVSELTVAFRFKNKYHRTVDSFAFSMTCVMKDAKLDKMTDLKSSLMNEIHMKAKNRIKCKKSKNHSKKKLHNKPLKAKSKNRDAQSPKLKYKCTVCKIKYPRKEDRKIHLCTPKVKTDSKKRPKPETSTAENTNQNSCVDVQTWIENVNKTEPVENKNEPVLENNCGELLQEFKYLQVSPESLLNVPHAQNMSNMLTDDYPHAMFNISKP